MFSILALSGFEAPAPLAEETLAQADVVLDSLAGLTAEAVKPSSSTY